MLGVHRPPRRAAVAAVALFVVAFGYAFRLVRPLSAGSVGPDAIAPVTELRRLLAGQPLEGFLTQTSKPLLDVVYGAVHALVPDWRAVALTAVVAFAMTVVLGAILAYRIGGLASAAFAAFGILVSPALLIDVSLAYAVTWLVLLLLVAGLAAVASPPRYGLAGVALMLGTLARPEGVAVTLVATAGLIVAEVMAIARRGTHPPRTAYRLLIGFLAIPILMAHDGLLFGNPLYWANAAAENSAGRNTLGLVGMVGWMGGHFVSQAALLPLSAVAVWLLARRRQWPILLGLLGVILGIAGLFVVSGARGTLIPARYLFPIDVGLVFASAIGVSALDLPSVRRDASRWIGAAPAATALPIALGLLAAVAVTPISLLDAPARSEVSRNLALHANANRVMGLLRSTLGPVPSWRGLPAGSGFEPQPLLIVAPQIRQQAVLDLDLPLTEVAYDWPRFVYPSNGRPAPGTLLYLDRHDDHNAHSRRELQISQPTVIAGRRYVPVYVSRQRGIWVLRVEAAGS